MADPIDFHALQFRILGEIARDLSSDANFPVYLDASIIIRDTLSDPMVSLDKVVQVVSLEPLIVAKLLRLANSVTYNPMGQPIAGARAAIHRLGFETVRTMSMSVAMEQLLLSKNMAGVQDIARRAWEHSIRVAAIARVLARHIGRVNAEDAMLAGIVHDIGVFYLLYRTSGYEEYKHHREELLNLVIGWHEDIGESLLTALGLPEHIIQAVHNHDQPKEFDTPQSLEHILYLANLLGGGNNLEWLDPEKRAAGKKEIPAHLVRYVEVLRELKDDIIDVQKGLGL